MPAEKDFQKYFCRFKNDSWSSPSSKVSSKVPASIGVYLVLIIIAIIGLFLKNLISY